MSFEDNNLTLARMKRDRDRLDKSLRWTPQEALEAALADIKLGRLTDIEVITVIVTTTHDEGEDRYSVNEGYVGTNGATGPKETYWVFGQILSYLNRWTIR